jgi:hypothetical protein
MTHAEQVAGTMREATGLPLHALRFTRMLPSLASLIASDSLQATNDWLLTTGYWLLATDDWLLMTGC